MRDANLKVKQNSIRFYIVKNFHNKIVVHFKLKEAVSHNGKKKPYSSRRNSKTLGENHILLSHFLFDEPECEAGTSRANDKIFFSRLDCSEVNLR